MTVSPDLLVLGSGSAAFAAAITATEAGAEVMLLEENAVGGTCVNVGCIPSKALLAPADLHFRSGHPPFAGIAPAASSARLTDLVSAKDELVGRLRTEKYLDVAGSHGFTIRHGHASFLDGNTVECAGEHLTASAILIATGATPTIPPIPGLRESGYLTSTSALELRQLPQELAVIGASAVGLELGQLFLHLGSHVTFLEAMDRIAPSEEPETSEALQRVLEDEGAVIHTGVAVRGVSNRSGRRFVSVVADGAERTIAADHLLVATGRRPTTALLGLDRAGITVTDGGAVDVDAELRTTNPRVLAAGDVTGGPQFVYVAAHEGALAARNAIMDHHETVDTTALPRVIFTAPAAAAAGLTERQAAERGLRCESRVLPLDAVPRALVNRDTRGFVKVVAEAESGRIRGVSAVADGAGDLIQAAVYAIQFGLTTDQVATTWAPYLTFAEGLRLAAQTFTRDVHQLSCCAV